MYAVLFTPRGEREDGKLRVFDELNKCSYHKHTCECTYYTYNTFNWQGPSKRSAHLALPTIYIYNADDDKLKAAAHVASRRASISNSP